MKHAETENIYPTARDQYIINVQNDQLTHVKTIRPRLIYTTYTARSKNGPNLSSTPLMRILSYPTKHFDPGHSIMASRMAYKFRS